MPDHERDDRQLALLEAYEHALANEHPGQVEIGVLDRGDHRDVGSGRPRLFHPGERRPVLGIDLEDDALGLLDRAQR